MTTTHKWVAGALAIAIAIFAGSWFLLVSPKRTEAADLQAQADEQAATNAGLQTELAVLKQQKKELPQQQAKLAGLQTQIPQTSDMPSLVRLLNQAGAKSGVDLVSFSPAAAVPVTSEASTTVVTEGVLPSEQLAAIDAQIVVTGGYFEIVKFLNSLENLQRYLLVTNTTIAPDDAASASPETTQKDAGQLTASLSSRVFLLPVVVEPTPVDAAAAPATESQ